MRRHLVGRGGWGLVLNLFFPLLLHIQEATGNNNTKGNVRKKTRNGRGGRSGGAMYLYDMI